MIPNGEKIKVLHLILTQDWYDKHESGEKDVEYRAMTEHWTRLIWDRRSVLTHVRYARGYSSRTIMKRITGITIGPCPYKGWEGRYYRIHHGGATCVS